MKKETSTSQLMSDTKFYSDYARWDDGLGRYESWEEAVERVMQMHRTKYADKITPELEAVFGYIQEAYNNKDMLGAQRALQFGGKQLLEKNARMYNCFAQGTRFVTDKGIKDFSDFSDGDTITVLTHKNRWKQAKVRSYGMQVLNKIEFNTRVNAESTIGRTVYATPNHRWLLKDGTETTSLEVGHQTIPLQGQVFDYDSAEPFEKLYWCYGYVYGDGTKVKDRDGNYKYSMVRLCRQGEDVKDYLTRFEEMGFASSSSLSLDGDCMVYTGSYLKTPPNPETDSPNLIRAFIYGYLAADGTKNRNFNGLSNRYSSLQSSEDSHSNIFRSLSAVAGEHVVREIDLTGEVTNFAPNGRKPTTKFVLRNSFGRGYNWTVRSIEEAVKEEEVWCLEVEDDQSFVLEGGIVTGNCVSSYADRPSFFGEFMWLMLCGCGAGFSVQEHHVAKLPDIKTRGKSVKKFLVPDSIEGWAEAFDVLFSSFFTSNTKHPEFQGHPIWFDFSQIRPKGAHISGGFKAPGPEPLAQALRKVELILTNAGKRIKPIEVYDACMHMADSVISGGVRRSATICLFSKTDKEMIAAKTGNWFIDNPQRGRSNNSVVLLRDELTLEEFAEIMKSVEHSGEPGFIFTDNTEFTFNPCVEIGKYPVNSKGESGWQACNLTEINGSHCNTPEDFYKACKAASAMGTLQAGYTSFDFLGQVSEEIIEREALIGVSVTGWMNNPEVLFSEEVMREGARIVKETNKQVAAMLGINPAARTTCVKPSGNASVLLKTASGIHGEHAPRYIRHVQMNNESEVLSTIKELFPDMVESSVWSTNGTDSVVAFPVISKQGSVYKADLKGVKQLDYVKRAQQVWVEEGTNVELCTHPLLRHNVSNTIDVDSWEDVTQYLYDNRKWFSGVSLMAGSGDKAFPQAPFTEVLTAEEAIEKYGPAAMFASGLVTRAIDSFSDLWQAIACATGRGESLSNQTHENAGKRDWVRQFDKFAANNFDGDKEKTGDCLKDVYNLHKWHKITNKVTDIDLKDFLKQKRFVDADSLAGAACAGGVCEITF